MGIVFVVTGFGKFRGVDKNPSEALVQALQVYLQERGKGIAEELPHHITEGDEVVLLHFGVDDKCRLDMKLEARAYNEATFRVPDEAGWQPQGEAIDPAEPLTQLETDLPVGTLADALRETGAAVAVSRNAGRFVCNYLLFRSLQRARRAAPRWHSLFVHVPCVGGERAARQLLELAGVLLDELSLSLARRPDPVASGPPEDPPQTQPLLHRGGNVEQANGHAAGEPGPPARAPAEPAQASKQVRASGGAGAAAANARDARGRSLWAACSVMLLLLVVRITLLDAGQGQAGVDGNAPQPRV